MGSDATAYLYYGTPIAATDGYDGDDESLQAALDDYEVDDWLLTKLGAPPVIAYPADDADAAGKAAWDKRWKERRDFRDALDVAVVRTGYHAEPQYALAIKESVRTADWSQDAPLNTAEIKANSEWVLRLVAAAQKLGLEPHVDWYLGAYYG